MEFYSLEDCFGFHEYPVLETPFHFLSYGGMFTFLKIHYYILKFAVASAKIGAGSTFVRKLSWPLLDGRKLLLSH